MDIENPYRTSNGVSQAPCTSIIRFSLRNLILCVIVIVGLLSVWVTHKNTYEEHNKVLSTKFQHLTENFNSGGGLRGSLSNPSANSNNNFNLKLSHDDDTKPNNININNGIGNSNDNSNKAVIEQKKLMLPLSTHQPTPSPTPVPTRHPTAHPTFHPTQLPTIHPTHTIIKEKEIIKKEQPKSQPIPQGNKIPTNTGSGNADSHVDYCAGNVDPFKNQSVESFKVPVKAPMSARRKWESSLKTMLDRVQKLSFGGQKLRDYLATEVEKLEILRFELFCSYA